MKKALFLVLLSISLPVLAESAPEVSALGISNEDYDTALITVARQAVLPSFFANNLDENKRWDRIVGIMLGLPYVNSYGKMHAPVDFKAYVAAYWARRPMPEIFIQESPNHSLGTLRMQDFSLMKSNILGDPNYRLYTEAQNKFSTVAYYFIAPAYQALQETQVDDAKLFMTEHSHGLSQREKAGLLKDASRKVMDLSLRPITWRSPVKYFNQKFNRTESQIDQTDEFWSPLRKECSNRLKCIRAVAVKLGLVAAALELDSLTVNDLNVAYFNTFHWSHLSPGSLEKFCSTNFAECAVYDLDELIGYQLVEMGETGSYSDGDLRTLSGRVHYTLLDHVSENGIAVYNPKNGKFINRAGLEYKDESLTALARRLQTYPVYKSHSDL